MLGVQLIVILIDWYVCLIVGWIDNVSIEGDLPNKAVDVLQIGIKEWTLWNVLGRVLQE